MFKKTILLIIINLLFSCVSKKISTEKKEVIKRDSIYIIKDRFITKQVNDTIVINEVCDTLGNLKSFDRVIKTNNVKVSLKSINGTIQATVDIDSIVNSRIQEFKESYKSKTEIKELKITKYRTPLTVWGVVAFEFLIILLLFRIRS